MEGGLAAWPKLGRHIDVLALITSPILIGLAIKTWRMEGREIEEAHWAFCRRHKFDPLMTANGRAGPLGRILDRRNGR